MSPELEAYFDNYNQLFNHQGFKQLIEELDNNITQLSNIENIKDAEELFYRKGQVAALTYIYNFENTIKTAREQAEAEELDDIYV